MVMVAGGAGHPRGCAGRPGRGAAAQARARGGGSGTSGGVQARDRAGQGEAAVSCSMPPPPPNDRPRLKQSSGSPLDWSAPSPSLTDCRDPPSEVSLPHASTCMCGAAANSGKQEPT